MLYQHSIPATIYWEFCVFTCVGWCLYISVWLSFAPIFEWRVILFFAFVSEMASTTPPQCFPEWKRKQVPQILCTKSYFSLKKPLNTSCTPFGGILSCAPGWSFSSSSKITFGCRSRWSTHRMCSFAQNRLTLTHFSGVNCRQPLYLSCVDLEKPHPCLIHLGAHGMEIKRQAQLCRILFCLSYYVPPIIHPHSIVNFNLYMF